MAESTLISLDLDIATGLTRWLINVDDLTPMENYVATEVWRIALRMFSHSHSGTLILADGLRGNALA
jgi:hypothetical protein